MANIWEKVISILAGNLNLGRIYLTTTVISAISYQKVNQNKSEVFEEGPIFFDEQSAK